MIEFIVGSIVGVWASSVGWYLCLKKIDEVLAKERRRKRRKTNDGNTIRTMDSP